jgi:hypothetical protein
VEREKRSSLELTTMTTKAELRSMACSMFMARPSISIDRGTPMRSLPITGTACFVHIPHIPLTWYPEPLRHARHIMPLDPRPVLRRPNRLRLCPFLCLPTQMPPAHEIVRDQVETHDIHGDAQ